MRDLRRLGGSRGGVLGVTGLGMAVALALIAPLLPLRSPYAQDVTRRLLPPSWMSGGSLAHPLGTDPLGRDLLARIVFGARASLLVGVAAVGVAGSVGTILGMVAGDASISSSCGWPTSSSGSRSSCWSSP